MNRRDGGVVVALLAILAILTGAIAVPAFRPAATPAPTSTAAPATRPRAGRPRPPLVDHAVDGPDPGGPRPRGAPVSWTRPARPRECDPPGSRRAVDGDREGRPLDIPPPARGDVARRRPGHEPRRRLHGGRPPRPGLRGTAGLDLGRGAGDRPRRADRPVRSRRSRGRVPPGGGAAAAARPHPVGRARRGACRRPVRARAARQRGVRPRRDDGRPGRPGAGAAAGGGRGRRPSRTRRRETSRRGSRACRGSSSASTTRPTISRRRSPPATSRARATCRRQSPSPSRRRRPTPAPSAIRR